MGAPGSPEDGDGGDDAFVRLREVLAAPERRAGRSVRQWVALPVLGAGVVLLVSALRAPEPSPAGRPHDASLAQPPAPALLTTTTAPPATAAPPLPARVWPPQEFSIEGNVVRRGDEAWEVGAPGDVVVLGDWDCDGAPTPAVLRLRDGGFFVFDRWAVDGDVVATRVAGFRGAVAAEAVGCGSAVLRTADGDVHEVATSGSGPGA